MYCTNHVFMLRFSISVCQPNGLSYRHERASKRVRQNVRRQRRRHVHGTGTRSRIETDHNSRNPERGSGHILFSSTLAVALRSRPYICWACVRESLDPPPLTDIQCRVLSCWPVKWNCTVLCVFCCGTQKLDNTVENMKRGRLFLL